jgi:hypothetical protein
VNDSLGATESCAASLWFSTIQTSNGHPDAAVVWRTQPGNPVVISTSFRSRESTRRDRRPRRRSSAAEHPRPFASLQLCFRTSSESRTQAHGAVQQCHSRAAHKTSTARLYGGQSGVASHLASSYRDADDNEHRLAILVESAGSAAALGIARRRNVYCLRTPAPCRQATPEAGRDTSIRTSPPASSSASGNSNSRPLPTG